MTVNDYDPIDDTFEDESEAPEESSNRTFLFVAGGLGVLILVVLLAILPMAMAAGTAYLAAIIVFTLALSGAGYLVNKKIT